MAARYSCLNNSPYGCDWNGDPINSDYTLRVSIGSWELKPESYASSMISLSSLFQAVFYFLFSSLADYGTYKIYLFRITAIISQFMHMTWIFFSNENWWLFAGWFGSISFIPFGLCLIFYNAYLQELVENHWRIRRLERLRDDKTFNGKNDKTAIEMIKTDAEVIYKQESTDLAKEQTMNEDKDKVTASEMKPNSEFGDDNEQYDKMKKKLLDRIQDDVSQWGFALGYCGSNCVTIICTVILFLVWDTRVDFVENIGINDINQVNNNHVKPIRFYMDDNNNFTYNYNIVNVEKQSEEFYVHPVINANVKYSILTIYDNNFDNISDSVPIDEFSWINGIQLMYDIDDDTVFGNLYGSNSTASHQVYVNQNITIRISSHKEQVGDIGNIMNISVFTNKYYDNLINAIEFNDNGKIFGVTNNTKEPKIINYNDFIFGGYQPSIASMNLEFDGFTTNDDSGLESDIEIISGFNSIAFVSEKGQYGSTLSLQLSYFINGFWFFIFSIPAYIWLKGRKRPPIPSHSNAWTISAKSYWETFKQARSYPDLLRYLLVWFLFSDAITTTASCGILFGQIELGMSSAELVIILIESEITGVMGAFFFVWLQKKLEWNCKQMLIMHLIIMALLPLYSAFGIIEGFPFGLVHKFEMYIFTFVFGFNQGSMWALSRSLFARFTPQGYEAQFFGLYGITDRGSSWIGPMMVAIISNYTNMRWSLFYIATFYLIAIPLLYYGVDYKRGILTAKLSVNDDVIATDIQPTETAESEIPETTSASIVSDDCEQDPVGFKE